MASHFPGTKSALASVTDCMASNTCLACDIPNRYMVHCHKFYPELLSQVDVLCDVLGESDLLQETVSDVSEYKLHEANIPSECGYYSPNQTVPAHLDASSGTKALVSTNKVPCPSSQGETSVDLPGKMGEILSSVLCEDTGCPNVKVPGQVLPLASTPSVSRENLTNAASMFTPLRETETFMEPHYPISCNSVVHPIEEKMLPSSIKFPAHSMTTSHLIGIDGYLEDHICWALTHVQHTSTHDYAINSLDEPLNCPRLVLMAKGQPHFEEITRNQLGYLPLGTHSIPKDSLSKRGGGNTNGTL